MSGPCLSSSVTDHPLRSVIRRSLGEPLPHQQADRPRDHLKALYDRALILEKCYSRATSGINSTFAELSRTLRQVSHVLRTRSPLSHWDRSPGIVRLACIKHAASVRPEPGSNSPSRSDHNYPRVFMARSKSPCCTFYRVEIP